MDRKTAKDFPQELLNLYDEYVHGQVGRRGFLERASQFAVGGLTAAGLLAALSPQYALAAQVEKDDERITVSYETYDSPQGGGKMRGYYARPAKVEGKLPFILVVHENRGLNPYIEDVTRRLAVAGFAAFAPDALTPLGGYPGNDDEGRNLQAQRDKGQMEQDFIAATKWMAAHPACDGKIGVVGFCFGGGMANTLAVKLPDLVKAAVPFYGGQPPAEDATKIKGALLLQFAEHDERVNAGWPAWEEALKKAGVKYEAHIYPGVNHGFHNDTTPRYDEAAAKLAWERTVEFFKKQLTGG
ncbi:dienelactone hydrolase family protein [Luteolibacter flavescens]|uniref:Dienelactone hydrolase family protein n=1 Tax=Luteolibacter flavescens TaxID=1859460 RepID=A0ABT3FTD0_9BACT|nr:dienelactone hydrolase family protein [Luteolibacter flavescens]MCW1886815.1 dienelactone hydrolase family protein [Luteolibacter flavescens]